MSCKLSLHGLNPARLKGHLDKILGRPEHIVKHHPALPYVKIGNLVAELQPRNDRNSLCLLLLICTAARVGAAVGASAEEFNLAKRVWTIPASRMNRRGKRKALPFPVPLSDAAVKAIERVGVKEGPLFPSADHSSLAKAHGRADITVHGFRSTFRDWCSEQTSYPREVIEMAMARVVVGETEEAYFRSDVLERRPQANGCVGRISQRAGRCFGEGCANPTGELTCPWGNIRWNDMSANCLTAEYGLRVRHTSRLLAWTAPSANTSSAAPSLADRCPTWRCLN